MLKLDSNKCTPTVATRVRPLRRSSRTPSHDKRSANIKAEFLKERRFWSDIYEQKNRVSFKMSGKVREGTWRGFLAIVNVRLFYISFSFTGKPLLMSRIVELYLERPQRRLFLLLISLNAFSIVNDWTKFIVNDSYKFTFRNSSNSNS